VWPRLTATTAERFFRIDRALEPAHYVTDIAAHDLYIVDPDLHTSFLAPTIIYCSDGDDVPPPAASPWLQGTSQPAHFSVTATNGTADSNDIHYRRYNKQIVYQLQELTVV